MWVADSILSNVDFDFLSSKMKKKVKNVKAYTASFEEKARFPNKNFIDVIDHEINKGSFNTLVIGGGSVDISNLDTNTDPEKNIPALRETVIASAHKLFSIAETVLSNYPAIRKVVLMKRTPRYDPAENDPMSLKPQLSSLADSVSFGIWCDSKFKDRLILGGQDIPSSDIEHRDVFGNPQEQDYDGLHMRGPAGRTFLTRSIQKVLMKAQLIEENNELYSHDGWKKVPYSTAQTNSPSHMGRVESHPANHRNDNRRPSMRYNPMGIMIQRIQSLSSATLNGKGASHQGNDDVFPAQSASARPVIQEPKVQSRTSVIRPGPNGLQNIYSVPVSNYFTALGN